VPLERFQFIGNHSHLAGAEPAEYRQHHRFVLYLVEAEKTSKSVTRRLRKNVQEHNVFRWAGELIAELSDLRVEVPNRGTMKDPVAGHAA